jgi:tRNA nucleotidyltransferase (CCA-adding enzyme)
VNGHRGVGSSVKRIEVPGPVRWIARTLEEAGFETWAVGGAVRDAMAGRPSEDWDLATRARPAEVQRVFRRTVPIGVAHGTVGVLDRKGTLHEVTTFRRDVETTGRHATVAFADSLEEDLARRDFTINAVALHPLRGTVEDPFGGLADLEAGLLRTVGSPEARFAEDYLRILRGLRFAGSFGLAIEGATWRALTAAVPRMGILSPERLREELEKVLGAATPPSATLALYVASGVMRFLYPELDRIVEHPRPGGGGWLAHGLRAADLLPPNRPSLRWAALVQGVGEPEEPAGAGEAGLPAGERALLRTAALLERLRSSNARIREISELARWVSHPPPMRSTDAELRRWIAGVGRERVNPLLRVWLAGARADELRGGPWDVPGVRALSGRLRALIRSGVPLAVSDLAFSGRDLIRAGFAPGPHFGEVLAHLLDRVLEDPSRNHPAYLQAEAVRWLEGRDSDPGGAR